MTEVRLEKESERAKERCEALQKTNLGSSAGGRSSVADSTTRSLARLGTEFRSALRDLFSGLLDAFSDLERKAKDRRKVRSGWRRAELMNRTSRWLTFPAV